MIFEFKNNTRLSISKNSIKDIDDDDDAFYIEETNFSYTIYKKELLYVIYTK